MRLERVRSEFREVELSETAILFFRVYFSSSHCEVLVSTEYATLPCFFQTVMHKGSERKRNIGFQLNF
jgi:hypothetical protein